MYGKSAVGYHPFVLFGNLIMIEVNFLLKFFSFLLLHCSNPAENRRIQGENSYLIRIRRDALVT